MLFDVEHTACVEDAGVAYLHLCVDDDVEGKIVDEDEEEEDGHEETLYNAMSRLRLLNRHHHQHRRLQA